MSQFLLSLQIPMLSINCQFGTPSNEYRLKFPFAFLCPLSIIDIVVEQFLQLHVIYICTYSCIHIYIYLSAYIYINLCKLKFIRVECQTISSGKCLAMILLLLIPIERVNFSSAHPRSNHKSTRQIFLHIPWFLCAVKLEKLCEMRKLHKNQRQQ